jgi:hypothetical protein
MDTLKKVIDSNPMSGGAGCLQTIRFFVCLACILAAVVTQSQNLENLGDQTPVRLTSGFALQTTFYSVSEIPYRRQPFNWSFSGTPVLHLYGVSLPFTFYLSNQQLGFQQPFNQFGISPTYKWATAHLGYSSVRFSDYTLAGRRFLGAGAELNPGKWRMGFVYGRFQKAVEQDSVVQATPESYLSGIPNGSFARKGYAAKVGYGTEQNYFDILFLKAQDDTNSIQKQLSMEVLQPESNKAIGIKHRFSGKSGIFWESDAAISFYTRDVDAEPIDTNDVPNFLYKIFDPKLTSQLLYAATTRAGYEGKQLKTSIRYRRISQDFKTMGAYYFQTDLEEYAVQFGTGLLKKKLHLRGNLGVQRNNLGDNRRHTTKRVFASFYAGAQFTPRLRAVVLFSNFGISQRPQQPGLADSIRIDQVLSSWQFSGSYQIPSKRPQSISLQVSTQDLAPREVGLTNVSEMSAVNGTAVYTISMPLIQLNIALVGQSITNKQPIGTLRSSGGGATVSKGLAKGKLSTQAGLRFFNTRFEEKDGNGTVTFDAGLNYRITQAWTARANLRYTSSDSSGQVPDVSFNETMVTLGSQFHF